MDRWRVLKEGKTHIHVSYGPSYSNNLHAQDIRLNTFQGVTFHLDLEENLRTKTPVTNSFQDAQELADGAINDLTLVQIDDQHVIDGLIRVLRSAGEVPIEWKLIVRLEREWSFRVHPELDGSRAARSLSLYVVQSNADQIEKR